MKSNDSVRTQVECRSLRPDARQRAAIVAKKIESARRMMSAFGRPMKF